MFILCSSPVEPVVVPNWSPLQPEPTVPPVATASDQAPAEEIADAKLAISDMDAQMENDLPDEAVSELHDQTQMWYDKLYGNNASSCRGCNSSWIGSMHG